MFGTCVVGLVLVGLVTLMYWAMRAGYWLLTTWLHWLTGNRP